jgi:anti-sigma-K factor RskA
MTDRQPRPHDEWDELAAGYALHALEPNDELAFTRHLADCAECEKLLPGHELIAAQLGSLADSAGEDATPPWSAIRAGVVGTDRPAVVVPLAEGRRRRRPSRVLAAAAAVVVLVAAGVIGWRVTGGSPSASSQAIARCAHTAGCNVVRLHASSGANPGVVLVSAGRATMVPLALRPPAADRTYVLWQLLRNGKPTAVRAFRQTKGEVSAPLVTSYANTAAFAVSLEPTGPLPTQPTEVLAVGNTST